MRERGVPLVPCPGPLPTAIVEDGVVRRGLLGVRIQPLDEALARSFGVDGRGVLIGDVAPGGAAERAGLRAGDVVRAFDGHAVEDVHGLRARVARTAPGRSLEVRVVRDGEERTLDVTLDAQPVGERAAT